MRAILLLFFLTVFAAQTEAQALEDLYKLFDPMPEVVENEQLRATIDSEHRIPFPFYGLLHHNSYSGNQLVPIGKIESPKAIILIYAVLTTNESQVNQPLLEVATIAFSSKNGEEIAGSLRNNLCMSGEDTAYRQARIEYDGEKVQFHDRLCNAKGEVQEVEIGVFEVGKKMLEFVDYR